ncbi:MAG: hypothetical protein MI923_16105 [Phycisphaerales bacterium]|nr:hypothetical protein [Phycisphaerales bacterium]
MQKQAEHGFHVDCKVSEIENGYLFVPLYPKGRPIYCKDEDEIKQAFAEHLKKINVRSAGADD